MSWLIHSLLLVSGVVVLAIGGEVLIRGAARLARALGVSALVVGLTVVAFGTSAPEAAVTILAASQGAPDLAVGNVVGSNICNVLLIIGLAAAFRPLTVAGNLLRVDGPAMLVTSLAFLAVAWATHGIGRAVGACFVLGLIIYTYSTYRLGRATYVHQVEAVPVTGYARHAWYNVVLVVLGIAALIGGARLMVDGGVGLARWLGVSERAIGLTIVAVGTSLPELATSVAAARQRQPDIAIGNVVGSNIFNVLFVAGLAALIQPLPVSAAVLWWDGPLMMAAGVLFYIVAGTGRCVTRWEGFLLLSAYAGYLVWTGLHAG